MTIKPIVWVVVVLLYALSVIPAVYSTRAYDSSLIHSGDVEVCYFSPIGGIKRSVQKIPLDKLVELKEKVGCETDPEKIISLLKEYGIITEDITVGYLRSYFNTHDISFKDNPVNNNHTFVNFNCAVIGVGTITLSIPFLIPLLGLFAPMISFVSIFGTLLTSNSLGGWYVYGTIYGLILGFVGLWVNMASIFHFILGVALFVVAGY